VVDSSATSFSSFRGTTFYEIWSFLAAYVDWIGGFIRFNGIRIVTKWASALNDKDNACCRGHVCCDWHLRRSWFQPPSKLKANILATRNRSCLRLDLLISDHGKRRGRVGLVGCFFIVVATEV